MSQGFLLLADGELEVFEKTGKLIDRSPKGFPGPGR
jgi:hypothetical protein